MSIIYISFVYNPGRRAGEAWVRRKEGCLFAAEKEELADERTGITSPNAG